MSFLGLKSSLSSKPNLIFSWLQTLLFLYPKSDFGFSKSGLFLVANLTFPIPKKDHFLIPNLIFPLSQIWSFLGLKLVLSFDSVSWNSKEIWCPKRRNLEKEHILFVSLPCLLINFFIRYKLLKHWLNSFMFPINLIKFLDGETSSNIKDFFFSKRMESKIFLSRERNTLQNLIKRVFLND